MPISRDQLKFDGVMVDRQEAKFSGAFDVEPEERDEILMDGYVMVVTVARCGPATIKPIEKTGDRVRVDTLKLADACIVVDEDLRDVLVDRLDLVWPEKLGLSEVEHLAGEKKRKADIVTGEIDTPEDGPAFQTTRGGDREIEQPSAQEQAKTKKAAKAKKEPEPVDESEEDEEEEEEWEDVAPPPPPRSGVVGDVDRPAPRDRSIREEDVFDPTKGERELVGQIASSKDPVLKNFLDSPD